MPAIRSMLRAEARSLLLRCLLPVPVHRNHIRALPSRRSNDRHLTICNRPQRTAKLEGRCLRRPCHMLNRTFRGATTRRINHHAPQFQVTFSSNSSTSDCPAHLPRPYPRELPQSLLLPKHLLQCFPIDSSRAATPGGVQHPRRLRPHRDLALGLKTTFQKALRSRLSALYCNPQCYHHQYHH